MQKTLSATEKVEDVGSFLSDSTDTDFSDTDEESSSSVGRVEQGTISSEEYDTESALAEAISVKADEGELVGRFRQGAFETKMRLFSIALVANVIFMLVIWVSSATFVHALFLVYILVGALPKFLFGSVLASHKLRTKSERKEKLNAEVDIEKSPQRKWNISVQCYKCPRCGKEIMGWQFCKSCGLSVTHDHPTLITACVTVHHEDREGLESGVRSFELSSLPFARRYFQLIYIIDGRLDRRGAPDPIQRETTRFLLAQLYKLDEMDVKDAPDWCLAVKGVKLEIIPDDGTAIYRGNLNGMPFIVMLKRKNKGKRDSHRMFFDYMQRGITERTAQGIFFVDSDTKFAWGDKVAGLSHLYKALVKSDNIGGACGEIEVAEWTTNALTMMQYFEYKSNQFLAKTAESWFGMVTCLPGAFCIIRPQALEQVLNEYLADSVDIWQKNRLDLGEDRTLTTLLLKAGWDTIYAQKAVALTKVPDTMSGLVKQRRRWINSTIVNMMVLLRTVKRVYALPLLIALTLELATSFTLPTAVLMMFVEIFAGMDLYRPFAVGIIVMWCIALMLLNAQSAFLERAL